MSDRKNTYLWSIVFICILVITPTTYAQQSASAGYVLEEIVVTARKREESLQDSPVAVTALSATDLEVRQLTTIADLDETVPNLVFDAVSPSSGANSTVMVFIRGIGQLDFTGVTDPGVGIYVDGVYYARSIGSAIDFLDLERVEVLRGPQGTLFGRNTIGGAINIITRSPADEFGGSVDLTFGSDERIDATLNVDMPVSDTVKTKLSLATRNRDGYVDNLITGNEHGDDNSQAIRGVIQWDAADNLRLTLNADYTREREESAPNTLIGVNPGSAFAGFHNFAPPGPLPPGTCTPPDPTGNPLCYSSDWIGAPDKDFAGLQSASDLDYWGWGLTVDWDLEWMKVKSITAYRDSDSFSTRDGDHSPLTIFQTTDDYQQDQFSQELQFSGLALDDRLKWLLGLYYFQEEGDYRNEVFISVGTLDSGGAWDHDTWAIFAEGTYDLTERLSLTAGLRYTEETKRFTPNQFYATPFGFAPGSIAGLSPAVFATYPASITGPILAAQAALGLPPNVAPPFAAAQVFVLPNREVSQKVDEVTPMVNLSYQLTDDMMVYGTYSRGFKSGGFTQRVAQILLETPSFEPEFVDSVEFGIKSMFLDDRLRLNGAFFWTDYSDLQILVRQAIAPVTLNAGEATMLGAELEMTFRATENLLLSGGMSWLDAEYDQVSAEAIANGITVNSKLPKAPDWKAYFSLAYTIPDEYFGGTFTPRFDGSYTSSIRHDPQNHPELIEDDYFLANVGLQFETNDNKWTAFLGVRNIGDEEYLSSGSWSLATGGYVEGVFARGREWSLMIRRRF